MYVYLCVVEGAAVDDSDIRHASFLPPHEPNRLSCPPRLCDASVTQRKNRVYAIRPFIDVSLTAAQNDGEGASGARHRDENHRGVHCDSGTGRKRPCLSRINK